MDTAAICTQALTGRWKRTNLGITADVSHDGYSYRVSLSRDPDGGKAFVDMREGWGGWEYVYAEFTWGQTMRLVDAAMGQLRVG